MSQVPLKTADKRLPKHKFAITMDDHGRLTIPKTIREIFSWGNGGSVFRCHVDFDNKILILVPFEAPDDDLAKRYFD